MKTILIYDKAYEQYDSEITIEEFNSSEEMIKFINENKIGNKIIASYEILKKIKFKKVEVVTKWEIES